jgi:glucosamine--fructose-6-phosphate aminotransferase (isomerizing)
VATLKNNEIKIYDLHKNEVKKETVDIEWDLEAATKSGYPHFMLKEIFEQPQSLRETLHRRLGEDGLVKFDDINLSKEELDKINRIYIVACGTAYNAGLVGKKALEKIAGLSAVVDVASEFRYDDPIMDENTLVIILSQSGETLDTLAALREAKKHGAKILSITNVIGSSIARESENVIYTWAGPEIAVASTKAYTTQCLCFFMLALDFAYKKDRISKKDYLEFLRKLEEIPGKVGQVLEMDDDIKSIAEKLKDSEHGFYLGRAMDYSIATEGSLKMKEVSYMHTEAFASGELKHGTIALIEDGIPVIALATQEKLFEKSVSNIKEVKSRGAYVIGIAQEGNKLVEEVSDSVLYLPKTDDLLAGLLSVVVLQLLAYHVSVLRGLDVDKPRNLAKSVTVE